MDNRPPLIDKETGAINMAELCRYNGKSEFDNLKTIVGILALKAEVYGITQKLRLTLKEAK